MKSITAIHQELHEIIQTQKREEIGSKVEAILGQNPDSYIPLGIEVDGVYLGLDCIPAHTKISTKIFRNIILVNHFSHESADLSRVYLPVYNERGEQLATLTEDVSENGKYGVFSEGSLFGPYETFLKSWFSHDAARSVFIVYEKNDRPLVPRKDNHSVFYQRIVRMPIIDLDHLNMHPMFTEMENQLGNQELLEENFLNKDYYRFNL